MQWHVHGERQIYTSPWVTLSLADVEIPGGRRFHHHVVRSPRDASGAVVHRRGEVLLLWRHRFITDAWGWEIPAGGVDGSESATDAARRETLEETGWRVGDLVPLLSYNPMNGISDQVFHAFVGSDASFEGEPTDPAESTRIAWVPLDEVKLAMASGVIRDGFTLTALAFAWGFGFLD